MDKNDNTHFPWDILCAATEYKYWPDSCCEKWTTDAALKQGWNSRVSARIVMRLIKSTDVSVDTHSTVKKLSLLFGNFQ